MGLRVTISTVRLGPVLHRVIRPATFAGRAALLDADRHAEGYFDRPAAAVLSAAWALAGRSPRSMVYLPLRAWPSPPVPPWCAEAEDLDLVLLPNAVQFPPSRWKDLRSRLGRGRPHTVTLPGTGLPEADDIDWSQPWRRRDLRLTVAARTLFVTGTPHEFQRSGHELPTLVHGRAEEHTCAEIFTDSKLLHLQLAAPGCL